LHGSDGAIRRSNQGPGAGTDAGPQRRLERPDLRNPGSLGKYDQAIEVGRAALKEKPRTSRRAIGRRWLDQTGRRDDLLKEFDWVVETIEQPLPQDAGERTCAGLLLQLYAAEAAGLPNSPSPSFINSSSRL